MYCIPTVRPLQLLQERLAIQVDADTVEAETFESWPVK